MRKTFALVAVALASLAAAAIAALVQPVVKPVPEPRAQTARGGALRMTTQFDRRYFNEAGGGEAYLVVDIAADAGAAPQRRVPVNAVLILDRSGSMHGAKIDRARDAARALITALGPDDSLAIVQFSSDAQIVFSRQKMDGVARHMAFEAVSEIEPMGGTNLSSALDLAARLGPVDKVFLASDGQANEGVSERGALLRLARRDFPSASISTFGMGDDYDEEFMTALASQAGGRARYINAPDILPGAFRDELSRASSMAARDVRLHIGGLGGATVQKVLGYDSEGGWVRLTDFASGEERRVLVKLQVPAGRGLADLAEVELKFEDAQNGGERCALARAQASFTADASLYSQPPTAVAVDGAKAEMADIAQQAARMQEQGRREEARAQIAQMHKLAAEAKAPEAMKQADEYDANISVIDAPGAPAAKAVKQKAFDAVRAPVAGW